MKQTLKRIMAYVLVLTMVLSIVPASALAATDPSWTVVDGSTAGVDKFVDEFELPITEAVLKEISDADYPASGKNWSYQVTTATTASASATWTSVTNLDGSEVIKWKAGENVFLRYHDSSDYHYCAEKDVSSTSIGDAKSVVTYAPAYTNQTQHEHMEYQLPNEGYSVYTVMPDSEEGVLYAAGSTVSFQTSMKYSAYSIDKLEDQYTAIYQDKDGKIFDVQMVNVGDDPVEPDVKDPGNKKIQNWAKSGTAAAGEFVIYTADYKEWDINLTVGEHAYVYGMDLTQQYAVGEEVKFMAVADEGYELNVDYKANELNDYGNGQYGFVIKQNNPNLEVTATAKDYTITKGTEDNATIKNIIPSATAHVGDVRDVVVEYAPGHEAFLLTAEAEDGSMVPLTKVGETATEASYRFTMPASNVTLNITAKASVFEVKFVVDGDLYNTQDVAMNDLPAKPADPKKEGYTFVAWVDEHGNEYGATDPLPAVTGAITYEAKFEQTDYTVSKGTQKLATIESITPANPVHAGDVIKVQIKYKPGHEESILTAIADGGVPVAMTKTADNGTTATYKFQMPAADVTLNVIAAPSEFEVKFVVDDDLYDTQNVAMDKAPTKPTAPSKDGYTFKGWTSDGVKVYTDVEPLPAVTGPITYKAHFEENKYTVTYDLETDIKVDNLTYGQEITLEKAPTKTGYEFVAWREGDKTTGAIYAAEAAYTVKGDATFYPVWKEEKVEFVVRYFTENGNLYDIQTVKKGDSVATPDYKDAKPGSTYEWKNGTTAVAPGASFTPAADIDLTATVTAESKYKVELFVKPSTAPQDITATVGPDMFKAGDTVTVKIKVPDGYSLKSVSSLSDSSKPVTGVLTPTDVAEFEYKFTMPAEKVNVTIDLEVVPAGKTAIRFMSDGVIVNYLVVDKGTSVEAPAAPGKAGSGFVQWNKTEGTGAPDSVNAGVMIDIDKNADDLIVYEAKWDAEKYTITYHHKDGTTDSISDLTYGKEVVLKEAPNVAGYTFVAWQDNDTNAKYAAKSVLTVKGNVNLTAVYAENKVEVTVKFFDEAKNLVDVFVVTKGDHVTAPNYAAARPDCNYKWFDAVNNAYLDMADVLTADKDYNFTIKMITEAEYKVNLDVVPAEVSDKVTATSGNHKMGDVITVHITVPEGYSLKNVSAVTNGTKTSVGGNLKLVTNGEYDYVFTMPAEDVDVKVTMEKLPAGTTAVKFMADGQLFDYAVIEKGTNGSAPVAAPKAGYTFDKWVSGTTYVGAGDSFSVAIDAPDEMIFEATWTAEQYTVNFDANGGTPDPAAMTGISYNKPITLPAALTKDGFIFAGWVEKSTGFTYAEKAQYIVKGDAEFTAKWVAAEYIVRFVDPTTGIIYGYEPIAKNQQVVAPVAPVVPGKTFVAWVNADDPLDTVKAGMKTPNITKNTLYNATFEVSEHTIAVNEVNCTVGDLAKTTGIKVGETVTFKVAPIAGFAIESVAISYTDGLSAVTRVLNPNGAGEYTFVMPDADVKIAAVAVQNVYAVHTSVDGNSKVDTKGVIEAKVGESVKFIAGSVENYTLSNVVVRTASGKVVPVIVDNEATLPNSYVFTMPAENVCIYVNSVQKQYTVTFLDADNTLLGNAPVKSGEKVDPSMVPAPAKAGFTFTGWVVLPEMTADFDPANDKVTSDMTVKATYVGDIHTVQPGLKENIYAMNAECTLTSGSTNSANLLNNNLDAEVGKVVYFTVAADYNYIIRDVAVVSANTNKTAVAPALYSREVKNDRTYETYSFVMPNDDVKIDVYTVAKLYNTAVMENIPEAGDYTINGHETNNLYVPQGETVEIAITPIKGYVVENISATFNDGLSVHSVPDFTWDAASGIYTFKMVGFNVLVNIDYKAIDYTVDVQTSNFETYKPDASVNPAKVVESLDPNLTSKGLIHIKGVADVDYTNALSQVYKIPNNGTKVVGNEVELTVTEYTGYDLDSLTVYYDSYKKTCALTRKGDSYFFVMPAEDVVVKAIFVEETYKVTKDAADEAHGQVVLNGLSENVINADYKEMVNVTVIPEPGYQVDSISYELSNTGVMDFDKASYPAAPAVLVDLQDVLDTEHKIDFHMPASDVNVNVTYSKIEYTVNVNNTNLGKADVTLTVDDAPNLSHVGSEVGFKVAPHYGYHVKAVSVDNDTTGDRIVHYTDDTNPADGAEYNFTMPASSVTVKVITVKNEYTVEYWDAYNSRVGVEKVDYLNQANVFAFKDNVVNGKPGYHFVGWTSDDVETPVTVPSTDNSKFVVVKDTIIKAQYEKDEIDVLFKAADHGVVTELSTGNTAEYRLDTTVFGDKVQFTAVPDEGYMTKSVTVTTNSGDAFMDTVIPYTRDGQKYTFTIPATLKESVHKQQASDVIVTVVFAKDLYNLTVADDTELNGKVSVNGVIDTETQFHYEYKDDVKIIATPDAGYYVASIVAMNESGAVEYSVTGTKPAMDTAAGDPLTLAFKMPAKHLTYKVDYEKIDYSITHEFNSVHGTVTTDHDPMAQIDDVVTVTAVPNLGYQLKGIKVTYDGGKNSCDVTPDDANTPTGENKFTFTMPAKAVTVTTVFEVVTYKVTHEVIGDGLVTLKGFDTDNNTAEYLSTVNFNVTPADGWKLESIVVDGGNVALNENIDPMGGDYSFTMPNRDVHIVVTLVKIDYSITAEFDSNHGNVTTDPAGIANVDDVVTVTVEPKLGYQLKGEPKVTYAGGEKSCQLTALGGNKFTFTMPAADVVVAVEFEVVTYTVTDTVIGEADVTIKGFDTNNNTAEYKSTVMISVVPADGWKLVDIVVDGGAVDLIEAIVPEGGDYTFTMPNRDVNVVVTLEKINFGMDAKGLHWNKVGLGTVTLDPVDTATVGDLVTISVDPDAGYRTKRVVVLDADRHPVPVTCVSGEEDYTGDWAFTMPASDVEITVFFEIHGGSYYYDVRTDDWSYEAITFVTDRQYFKGMTDTLFMPQAKMNRAMFVTVLGRMEHIDVASYDGVASQFTDLEAGRFYVPYVAWAAENNIVVGRDATTFDPMGNISREEMAAIMYRYCEYKGIDVTLVNPEFMDKYTDVDEIHAWAMTYMQWAVGSGLIHGMTDTTINPRHMATRAQVAQIIKNFCDDVVYE